MSLVWVHNINNGIKNPPNWYQSCNTNHISMLSQDERILVLRFRVPILSQYHPNTTFDMRVIEPWYEGSCTVFRPKYYQNLINSQMSIPYWFLNKNLWNPHYIQPRCIKKLWHQLNTGRHTTWGNSCRKEWIISCNKMLEPSNWDDLQETAKSPKAVKFMATLQNSSVLSLLVLLEEEQIIQLVKISPLIYAMNGMK
jgi:hypothetical protein